MLSCPELSFIALGTTVMKSQAGLLFSSTPVFPTRGQLLGHTQMCGGHVTFPGVVHASTHTAQERFMEQFIVGERVCMCVSCVRVRGSAVHVGERNGVWADEHGGPQGRPRLGGQG